MISRVEGHLERVDESGEAELRIGEVWYTLLIPGCDRQRLAARIGETVVLHTLHYLEGSAQGANYTPRLIGFTSPLDRAFFELFTTVKGVGNRKALRALQLPFPDVAAAIAQKDVKLLQTLPEIGKRSAETIVAELHGKVDRFVQVVDDPNQPTRDVDRGMADEALAVLLALGEPKLEMMQLVSRAIAADPEIESAQELITAVYRLRE